MGAAATPPGFGRTKRVPSEMEVVEGMLKGAQEPAWLEKQVAGGLKAWQIIFLAFAGAMAIVVGICCCIRFRVPRTKQQIEADYQRRIITKKFRQQLERIQNSQMDSIDLKAALEIVRADFRKDVENGQRRSLSLVSSVASNAPSSNEGSDKSSRLLNDRPAEENKPARNSGGFGSRLIALVRLSKQQKPQDVVC